MAKKRVVKKNSKKNSKKSIEKKSVSGFFKENYSKSWQYIKESKKFIWIVFGLFLLSVFIGVIFQPESISNSIIKYIQEIISKTEGMSSWDMIKFIFVNNIQTAFMGLIFGFALGIFPIVVTVANGYVVGYVSSSVVASSGAIHLLELIPHGIFELPAIFISFGMGLKFGTFVFSKEKLKSFNKFFIESLRVFVFVIIPLLIIAAIIEGSLIYLL